MRGGTAEDQRAGVGALSERIGVRFKSPALLDIALTHRSYAYEREGLETNERLELLGDAVLNLFITDMLYRRFPSYVEGDLAKLRASLVSTPALAELAAELGIGDAVKLGKGEEMTGGRRKASILADALEALIGAIFLDSGLATSRRVIRSVFGPRVRRAVGREVPKDAKTRLQEWVARLHRELPSYRISTEGPDHEKRFSADVYVAGDLYGRGEGRSKKEAEQQAAAAAMSRLREEALEQQAEAVEA